MGRRNVLPSAISPMWKGAVLAGQAFTIRTSPGDNRPLHDALESVRPGDVVVVDGCSEENRALIGELIAGRYKAAGSAGFVLDGAVRDVEDLELMQFPVFARSVTPAGPFRDLPGEIGSTIQIGDVVIKPGDYVIGDGDGVVIVPFGEAEGVLARAKAKFVLEEKERLRILGLLAGK
jgi:regulator of RNase E activity RraA